MKDLALLVLFTISAGAMEEPPLSPSAFAATLKEYLSDDEADAHEQEQEEEGNKEVVYVCGVPQNFCQWASMYAQEVRGHRSDHRKPVGDPSDAEYHETVNSPIQEVAHRLFPFSCKDCTRVFRTAQALEGHQFFHRKETGIAPVDFRAKIIWREAKAAYKCDIADCKESFPSFKGLKQHQRRGHHNIPKPVPILPPAAASPAGLEGEHSQIDLCTPDLAAVMASYHQLLDGSPHALSPPASSLMPLPLPITQPSLPAPQPHDAPAEKHSNARTRFECNYNGCAYQCQHLVILLGHRHKMHTQQLRPYRCSNCGTALMPGGIWAHNRKFHADVIPVPRCICAETLTPETKAVISHPPKRIRVQAKEF